MAASKISNQSTRASAILKVVGIYLLTLTILTLVFNLTKARAEGVDISCNEKFEQVQKNQKNLSSMVSLLDSIAKVNAELQALNQKDVEQAEGEGADIDEAEIVLANLQKSLSEETGGHLLNEEREKAKRINKHFRRTTDRLRSLREQLAEQVEKHEEELEEQQGNFEEENEDLDEKIDEQTGNLQVNSDELDDLQKRNGQLVQAAEQWKTHKADLIAEVKELESKIEAKLEDKAFLKGKEWKEFSRELKGELSNLLLRMELQSQ